MTTAELATALPEIVTEQVPGLKSKELLDRRDAAIPKALAEKHIRSASNRDQEPCLKIWTEINSLTGLAVSAS